MVPFSRRFFPTLFAASSAGDVSLREVMALEQ